MIRLLVCVMAVLALGRAHLVNLASQENDASCIVSSTLDETTSCDLALDGREDPVESEWISRREEEESWFFASFQSLGRADEVRLLQRCNAADRTKQVQLQFSDGSNHTVDLSCEGSSSAEDCNSTIWEGEVLPVAKLTNYVNITVTQVCSNGAFNGFREIVVLGVPAVDLTTNVALMTKGGTCHSSSDFDIGSTCRFGIDGVVASEGSTYWRSSDIEDPVGSWFEVSLPTQSAISQVRFKSRCRWSQQMQTAQLDFGDGSSETVNLNCYNGDDNVCPDQLWEEIPVPNIVTDSVRITGVTKCVEHGEFFTLQEFEVYGVEL